MNSLPNILKYKYPNIDLTKDVVLKDDGNGVVYIDSWNYSQPQPSQDELNTLLNDNALYIKTILNEQINKLQNFIDFKATEKQYDNAVSLATYISSTNTTWSAEASAFISWRDSVWEYALTTQSQIINGDRTIPTFEEFLTELPILVWPD